MFFESLQNCCLVEKEEKHRRFFFTLKILKSRKTFSNKEQKQIKFEISKKVFWLLINFLLTFMRWSVMLHTRLAKSFDVPRIKIPVESKSSEFTAWFDPIRVPRSSAVFPPIWCWKSVQEKKETGERERTKGNHRNVIEKFTEPLVYQLSWSRLTFADIEKLDFPISAASSNNPLQRRPFHRIHLAVMTIELEEHFVGNFIAKEHIRSRRHRPVKHIITLDDFKRARWSFDARLACSFGQLTFHLLVLLSGKEWSKSVVVKKK